MRRTGIYMIVMLLVCLIASGCGEKPEKEKSEYKLYYLSPTEDTLASDSYTPSERITASMVQEIRNKLMEPVESDEYIRLLPDQVEILDCEFDGQNVTLNFNDAYKKMKNTREILVRAGIVKSFTQIPGVINVYFHMNGAPMKDSEGNDLGRMDKDSFVENEGKNINTYVYMDFNLYFANKDGEKLTVEKGDGYYSSNVPLEKVIVEQLIKGPKSSNSKATISPETKILGVSIVEGICYVNLDKNFTLQTMNVQEKLPIYSIVNSLMDACRIHGVQISVEGENKVTFRESMSLDKLYKADYSLVEEEKSDD